MSFYKYVILGGGVAAGYAAREFADHGISTGELCIVSAEETLPYERPPLSKEFLAGNAKEEEILINDRAFYDEHGIEIKLGTRVTAVDCDAKELYAADKTFSYDRLMIATGARPVNLDVPGSALQNIFYLRRLEDARQIREAANGAKKAVVIGGSFIGMEAASVLQEGLGIETTMLFPEERVWQAFFTAPMSSYFENYYREQGVEILSEEEVTAFEGEDQLTHVITRSGLLLPADLVVAGVGAAPRTELFKDSGLEVVDDGIIVNRFLKTNLPHVWAAGDVTIYRDLIYKRPMHVEHWDCPARLLPVIVLLVQRSCGPSNIQFSFTQPLHFFRVAAAVSMWLYPVWIASTTLLTHACGSVI